jgi:PIN domain nuclease of toxin-antitoxin system
VILLDTHVLWWLDQKISTMGVQARAAADNALSEDKLAVSAISFGEVAALITRRRLALEPSVRAWRHRILGQGVLEAPVDGEVAIRAVDLPDLHRDPADRLIVASALALDATLLTADGRLLASPGPLRRADART